MTFLDCLALTFCDFIGDLLLEWACLTLQGGTTFFPDVILGGYSYLKGEKIVLYLLQTSAVLIW